MLTDTSRWSHARGNEVVPYRWQATTGHFGFQTTENFSIAGAAVDVP